jgi:hypothetical protein
MRRGAFGLIQRLVEITAVHLSTIAIKICPGKPIPSSR